MLGATMTKTCAALSFSMLATLAGCASPTSNDSTDAPAAEEELKSADCPGSVEITLAKPKVMTDAKLIESWTKDFQSDYGDAAKEAHEQLTTLASHLTQARSEESVTLKGTVAQACFYKTVDAATGQPNGYTIWFAKTGSALQMRISRNLGGPDTLFFKTPVKKLTPTALELEPGKDALVYAQHNVPEYHGEPGGPNAWIGFANVSAKLTH